MSDAVTGECVIRVLVVISGGRWRHYEAGWWRWCGHAMRHSELETTVRAPAIKVKGCHFFW